MKQQKPNNNVVYNEEFDRQKTLKLEAKNKTSLNCTSRMSLSEAKYQNLFLPRLLLKLHFRQLSSLLSSLRLLLLALLFRSDAAILKASQIIHLESASYHLAMLSPTTSKRNPVDMAA